MTTLAAPAPTTPSLIQASLGFLASTAILTAAMALLAGL
jgi:hypothetical protein